MNVVFLPEVQEYYGYLEQILYEKGYFGSMEYSQKYVKELIEDIKTNLPIKQHNPAPKHFDKYGKGLYYASFNKNKQTTWYAFFNKYEVNKEIIYLIRYIANNHTAAQYLEVS